VARLDKASLREEFDSLKGQFEQLCAEGKMGAASRALRKQGENKGTLRR